MKDKLRHVLEARDEGLHKIALMEFLNTQTVFLYFEPAMFTKEKFLRDQDGQIIESSYEARLDMAHNLLRNYQIDINKQSIVLIRLKTLISLETNSVKSTLTIKSNSQTQTIEVT